MIQPQTVVTSPILSAKRRHYSSNLGSNFGTNLSVPRRRVARSLQGMRKYADSYPSSTNSENTAPSSSPEETFAAIKISFEPSSSIRRSSGSESKKPNSTPSVAGALFALKQWICKHFYVSQVVIECLLCIGVLHKYANRTLRLFLETEPTLFQSSRNMAKLI